jgi:hypothetical protein
MNLLKSYYNMHLKEKQIISKRKTKRRVKRYKRLSPTKIFVGKGNLKHTNDKVVITLYVYNTEKLYLNRVYKKQIVNLFFPKKKEVLTLKELYKILIKPENYDIYFNYVLSLVNKINFFFKVINQYSDYLNKLVTTKVINEQEKLAIFYNKAKYFYALEYPNFNTYLNKAIKIYISKYLKYRYLLRINKAKFETPFLQSLNKLVRNMYKKKVEFNVVNLKKMHLNSDIFTQIITSKLKNRDNKLFRVLRSSLSKVKIPIFSRISEKKSKPNKNEFLINKIRNSYINSMFENKIINIDSLNKLLFKFFPSVENLEIEKKKRKSTTK